MHPWQALPASDHDSKRQGAVTPSLSFLKDIPEHPGDSWYSGLVSVVLHDATFEKSDPFFHAANLMHLLRQRRAAAQLVADMADDDFNFTTLNSLETLFLSIQSDGGADHNNSHLMVKLSLLALKRCLKLKRCDTQRCAANNSASLVHERAFSLLNLGLQHTSFARPEMEPDLETMVQHLSSMSEIRHAAGVGPGPRRAKVKGESTKAEKRPLLPVEENDDEDNEEESGYVVKEITAMRTLKGGEKEYFVKWGPPHNEEEGWEMWLPRAKLEASAPDKLHEFRLLTEVAAEEVAAEEAEAEAAKVKEASAAAAAEASKAATLEKQRRLREGWRKAFGKVIALIKQRLELLELKGKRVECPPVAPPEVLAELHDSLRALDPSYDPKYHLNSDLSKMPIIHKLLTDASHTFDSTYMLSMQDCECKDCEFGCSGWAHVPTKLKGLLCCQPVLPMLNPKEPGHMLQYDEAAVLPGGTSERDLPSKKDMPGAEMQLRLKKDKDKDLHPSKVCHCIW